MYLVVLLLTYFSVNVNTSESENLFNLDPDELFKSVIGYTPDCIRETTHGLPNITDDYNDNATESHFRIPRLKPVTVVRNRKTKKNETTRRRRRTTTNKVAGPTKEPSVFDKHPAPKTVDELKNRMREIEIEIIMNNQINPLPNFKRGDDDPVVITRRFDQMLDDQEKYLRGRKRRRLIRRRNIWRNRTITIMEHFIYATRYKLPYSQLLRKKYINSNRYRLGFLFGLLHQLKRQQLLMFTQLEYFKFKISTVHTHLRLYEKIVRLDVDIKDVMRLIRQYESKRRLKEDPDYYEEFIIVRDGDD